MEPDEEKIYKLFYKSVSCSHLATLLGWPNDSKHIKRLKKKIKELDLDIHHWGAPKIKKVSSIKENLHNILIENSNFSSNTKLKEILIQENILSNKCSLCWSPPFWHGLPLVLQLDHINGNNRDNRLENLRLLCPNCHSQTETYSGRNKKKKESL